jgi:hypothetical protein
MKSRGRILDLLEVGARAVSGSFGIFARPQRALPRWRCIPPQLEARAIDLVMSTFKCGQNGTRDAAYVLRIPERTARTVVSKLTEQGFLKSSTPKGPVRVAFPLEYRERFFTNLFAEGKIDAPEPTVLQFGR